MSNFTLLPGGRVLPNYKGHPIDIQYTGPDPLALNLTAEAGDTRVCFGCYGFYVKQRLVRPLRFSRDVSELCEDCVEGYTYSLLNRRGEN